MGGGSVAAAAADARDGDSPPVGVGDDDAPLGSRVVLGGLG
jgi:hypothetical protein